MPTQWNDDYGNAHYAPPGMEYDAWGNLNPVAISPDYQAPSAANNYTQIGTLTAGQGAGAYYANGPDGGTTWVGGTSPTAWYEDPANYRANYSPNGDKSVQGGFVRPGSPPNSTNPNDYRPVANSKPESGALQDIFNSISQIPSQAGSLATALAPVALPALAFNAPAILAALGDGASGGALDSALSSGFNAGTTAANAGGLQLAANGVVDAGGAAAGTLGGGLQAGSGAALGAGSAALGGGLQAGTGAGIGSLADLASGGLGAGATTGGLGLATGGGAGLTGLGDLAAGGLGAGLATGGLGLQTAATGAGLGVGVPATAASLAAAAGAAAPAAASALPPEVIPGTEPPGTATGGTGSGNPLGGTGGTIATTAAAGTALSRILAGNGTAADFASILGAAAPGLISAYGSDQQAKTLSDLAAKYDAYGAPSRARYEASMSPGFDPTTIPGYSGALDTASQSILRKLSTQGNPFGNPGGLIEANKAVVSGTALPAIQQYQNQNANTGALGQLAGSVAGANTAATNANSNVYSDLGSAFGAVTNPPTSLSDLLKSLKSSGYALA